MADLAESITQEQKGAVLAGENIRLGGWLERIARVQRELTDFAGRGSAIDFLRAKISFDDIPEWASVTVTPTEDVNLDGVSKTIDGPLEDGYTFYNHASPFVALGGSIQAHLRQEGPSRREQSMAAKLVFLERSRDGAEHLSDRYKGVIVPRQLIPEQVVIAIVDGETQPVE